MADQRCATCTYFKRGRRQQFQNGKINRLTFYCIHPMADHFQSKLTVNGGLGFVCFGDMKTDRPTVKTSPRWCPLKQLKEGDTSAIEAK